MTTTEATLAKIQTALERGDRTEARRFTELLTGLRGRPEEVSVEAGGRTVQVDFPVALVRLLRLALR